MEELKRAQVALGVCRGVLRDAESTLSDAAARVSHHEALFLHAPPCLLETKDMPLPHSLPLGAEAAERQLADLQTQLEQARQQIHTLQQVLSRCYFNIDIFFSDYVAIVRGREQNLQDFRSSFSRLGSRSTYSCRYCR